MFNWQKRGVESVDAARHNPAADDLRCSFCNKGQPDVRKLIAGPTVFICDECVDVCVDIILQDRNVHEVPQTSAGDQRPTGIDAVLRERAITCALCGKTGMPDGLLTIENRGVLCGECADAVEDALSSGRPIS